MLKKDLAAALGVVPSMVTKLAKRGMPTDSVERAERWRKRHLEQGMVKGVRREPRRAGAVDLVAHVRALAQAAVEDWAEWGEQLRASLAAVPASKAAQVQLPATAWALLIGEDDWAQLWPASEEQPPPVLGGWFLVGVAAGNIRV